MAHTTVICPLRSARLFCAAALEATFFNATTVPPIACAQEFRRERCDVLPMIEVQIAGLHKWFLVDTAATSMLNLESFASGQARDLHVTSWSGTLATQREGSHTSRLDRGKNHTYGAEVAGHRSLRHWKGSRDEKSDGILGVDLLGKLGGSIHLKDQTIHVATADEMHGAEMVAAMQHEMHRCVETFCNASDEEKFGDCLYSKDCALLDQYGTLRARAKSSAISAGDTSTSSRPQSWKSMRAPFIRSAKRSGTNTNLRLTQRGAGFMAAAWPCAKNRKDIGEWRACIIPSQSWNRRHFRRKNVRLGVNSSVCLPAFNRFRQAPIFSGTCIVYSP